MKITRKVLRRIIRECGDEMSAMSSVEQLPGMHPDDSAGMPCPIAAAADLREAGASDADVLDWIQKLLSSFAHGDNEEFSFTGDVSLLSGDEAFGIGYSAAKAGE